MTSKKQKTIQFEGQFKNFAINKIPSDLLIFILNYFNINEIKLLMYINRFFNNFFKEHGEIIWKEKLKYYHKNRYFLKISKIKYEHTSWKELFDISYITLFYKNKISYEGGGYYNKRLHQYLPNITSINIRYGQGTNYYENGKKCYDGEWKDGKWDGQGTNYYENGKIHYDGEWKDGNKVNLEDL